MKILYFDCLSGISGDMTLGALLDLGLDIDAFKAELSKLGLDHEFKLNTAKVTRNGICAMDVDVVLTHTHHEHDHHHDHEHPRNLRDINAIIDASGLSNSVKANAKQIFLQVAKAEATVHYKDINQVHFHEVGATDSIVDIVGVSIAIDMLRPDRILSSPLYEGTGFVKCEHGIMPVPAPATAEIMKNAAIPFIITDEQGEMVTPTGAAIIAALAQGFGAPEGRILTAIGYGCGKRQFKRPNLLRAMLIETGDGAKNEVCIMQANVDDQTPEALAFALERIFEAGALDAYFTPIYMKKNRPAVMLTALCGLDNAPLIEDAILTHTTTIGLRRHTAQRTVLDRSIINTTTPYGEIRVKGVQYKNTKRFAPEYEDVKKAAINNNVAFNEVYNIARQAAENN